MAEVTTQRDSTSIRQPYPTSPTGIEAVEIEEGILWFRLPLPMALDHVNIFAFLDQDGWTLIDCGMNTDETRSLWPQILHGVLRGKPVRRVILTHHHPDHVGMAGWFQSHLKAEILATRTAWLMARMLTLDIQDRPSPETITYQERSGVPPDLLEKYKNRRPFNFADCVMPMPLGFTRIQEGDRLSFGGREWRVRIGHGHAPAHATLWCEEADMVVGGDQFLLDITPNIGVYATEPGANPLKEWLASCRAFSRYARPEQLVLPGHKKPFYGLPLRLEQLIDNHHTALDRIKAELTTPLTVHEILEPLFERPIRRKEYGLAMAEAVAHMNWLYQAGQVNRIVDSSDGAWRYQRS